MIKVLFVCHGNICRSTMAQYLFIHIAENAGYQVSDIPGMKADIFVDSAATSREEIGNPVDRRTVNKLKEHGISCGSHRARQITKSDYAHFDHIIIMDRENEWGIKRIIPEDPDNKIHLMMEYADADEYKTGKSEAGDVSDPWYTHDFERTYTDLLKGCTGLMKLIEG